MIGEFSLNNDTKPAQLEKDVGPVFAVNVDRLGVRRDSKARNKDGKLSVDNLLPVSIKCHLPFSFCAARKFAS